MLRLASSLISIASKRRLRAKPNAWSMRFASHHPIRSSLAKPLPARRTICAPRGPARLVSLRRV